MEETENLCLMAREDEPLSDGGNEGIKNFTLDELYEAFGDLHDEFQKLGIKYVTLKKSSNELDMELNALRKEKMDLYKENLFLKKEAEKFSNIAYKLTNGKENLEKFLGSQRQSLSKHGIGYNYFMPKKSSKTIYVKQENLVDNACSYCGVNEHFAYSRKLR